MAPFPARTDTVAPGDLRGPFDGVVQDQSSGNPIATALIYVTWAYEKLGPLPVPVTTITAQVVTKSDGTYEIPVHDTLDQPGVVLRKFTLLCYKAGYLGYRSDRRWEDGAARRDFAQHGNRIRLERFPEGESHARHVTFLGGGEAVRRAAQAEVVQAALELSEAQRPPPPLKKVEAPPPSWPPAETLLTEADVRDVTGSKLGLVGEPLPDTVMGGANDKEARGLVEYRGVHLRAQGKGESFDAGLRLWRLGSADSVLADLRQALGKVQEGHEVGDVTLKAFDSKRRLYGVVALLRKAGVVAQLSCGASLCKRDEMAVQLLQRALQRLPMPSTNDERAVDSQPPLKLRIQ